MSDPHEQGQRLGCANSACEFCYGVESPHQQALKLEADLTEARQRVTALTRYAQHKHNCVTNHGWAECSKGHQRQVYQSGKHFCDVCGKWFMVKPFPCTCGLAALLGGAET